MMAEVGYQVLAGIFSCLAGLLGMRLALTRRMAAKRRAASKAKNGIEEKFGELGVSGVELALLQYLARLERRLAHKATRMLVPRSWARWGNSAGRSLCLRRAGLEGGVSLRAICEAQFRVGFLGGAVGSVLGACVSNELGLMLGFLGLVLGFRAPMHSVRRAQTMRSASCKRDLPEFLEVVSLGLRSGLTFDRSFQLYSSHFETCLARSCASAQQKWTLGLSTREEALQELASSYDSDLLRRVVDTIVRSMRFGTTLADDLEKAASDSQAEQRTARQEEVAKAPVRMMIPTTTLILPAMLLFVLGPVLLELMEGF